MLGLRWIGWKDLTLATKTRGTHGLVVFLLTFLFSNVFFWFGLEPYK